MYTFHVGEYLPMQRDPREQEATRLQSSSGMMAIKQRIFFVERWGVGMEYTSIFHPDDILGKAPSLF